MEKSWRSAGQAMIRLDMSEFSEPHSVSRLIGVPPGYASGLRRHRKLQRTLQRFEVG
jgi:ATP-dependent Clp protease ATP-binding subunit ClpC